MGANVAGIKIEVCPDEGRPIRSSPLRRHAQRFGRRHSQSPIEFPCSAPQRDGKSHKRPGIRRMSDSIVSSDNSLLEMLSEVTCYLLIIVLILEVFRSVKDKYR